MNTATSRLDEIRKKLLDAYTETENVRLNNAQLEIKKNTLESVIREKNMELKYIKVILSPCRYLWWGRLEC